MVSPTSMWVSPKPPGPSSAPATMNTNELDSTVRAAIPDTDTAMSSITPYARISDCMVGSYVIAACRRPWSGAATKV
ncbi:hypothetical protein [Mycobacterium sp. HUMS_1102779]|uniref:hypothetical protein n=1 Tax=Mycobacterium sp. HUMS_1102779 TaxID=3383487 RepID=UPI00389A6A79